MSRPGTGTGSGTPATVAALGGAPGHGQGAGNTHTHTPSGNPLFTHTSPTPSPRRAHFPNGPAGPGSPRLGRAHTPVMPSIGSSTNLMEQDSPGSNADSPSRRTNLVMGFSPGSSSSVLPAVSVSSASTFTPGSPSRLPLGLNVNSPLARLSPQLNTPIEGTFFPEGSPRMRNSPRNWANELPPRSRRNSAAIVSISLSSRSRSRTPKGAENALPGNGSGSATPNKGSSTVTPKYEGSGPGKASRDNTVQMGPSASRSNRTSWGHGADVLDEWQPAGGMLLEDDDDDDDEVSAAEKDLDRYDDDHDDGRVWSGISDASREVDDVLQRGMLFGEGLEFQGEIIVPAIGREGTDDAGLPLRRGGSEVGKKSRSAPEVDVRLEPAAKKVYEVVRKLGSGSYAVVYLVREKSGRKKEYALKCLSKANLEEEQIETQLFEAHIHLSLPIHTNIVTLHQTLQTEKWLFLMLELCPGEDLFYWLEKSRDASPPPAHAQLAEEPSHPMSSSKFSASSIPFSSSAMFSGLASHMPMSMSLSSSFSNSPTNHFSPNGGHSASPASLLFAHHNGHHSHHSNYALAQTPPTPSLLSAFSANTLLSPRRLRLIASMFAQMCEAVAVCHEAGVSHRDIKPENFICCDSVELETVQEGDDLDGGFGPQAKRKVVVKLTDFGLATTEEESGDVECGSRPYMSYECRNNLGPTYFPAQADVWSLGIVLINMLFHRNPWKDPCPGDPNFDKFLDDPIFFLLSKFTGIGKEVATFIATHVLCVDVGDRVGARELGKWVKGLPEMIGGRRAVKDLRKVNTAAKANGLGVAVGPGDSGMFVKSPVQAHPTSRKVSASALTSSAPISAPPVTVLPVFNQAAEDPAPRLSSLPPPSDLASARTPTPELEQEQDDPHTASTIDGQPTPTDQSALPSPDQMDLASPIDDATSPTQTETDDGRSLSTHKRKKRGVRKGKAAQAALAAAASGSETTSQAERDALLAELANASQSLARDLSKHSKPNDIDPTNTEEFPPLGTTPAQLAAAKKSKWKDLMKFSASSGNPELAALARRVAERDAGSGGNWSAPAKLQDDHRAQLGGGPGGLARSGLRQTATVSSEVSSALSSFGRVSSVTSSSVGISAEDEDWRVRREIDKPSPLPALPDPSRPEAEDVSSQTTKITGSRQDRDERAKKAALAAAALTGSIGPMGAFGKGPAGVPRHGPLHGRNIANGPVGLGPGPGSGSGSALAMPTSGQLGTNTGSGPRLAQPLAPPLSTGQPIKSSQVQAPPASITKPYVPPPVQSHTQSQPPSSLFSVQSKASTAGTTTTFTSSADSTRPTLSTISSQSTYGAHGHGHASGPGLNANEADAAVSPHKPKLKGQIQSLAKMLSGLKTKGKD